MEAICFWVSNSFWCNIFWKCWRVLNQNISFTVLGPRSLFSISWAHISVEINLPQHRARHGRGGGGGGLRHLRVGDNQGAVRERDVAVTVLLIILMMVDSILGVVADIVHVQPGVWCRGDWALDPGESVSIIQALFTVFCFIFRQSLCLLVYQILLSRDNLNIKCRESPLYKVYYTTFKHPNFSHFWWIILQIWNKDHTFFRIPCSSPTCMRDSCFLMRFSLTVLIWFSRRWSAVTGTVTVCAVSMVSPARLLQTPVLHLLSPLVIVTPYLVLPESEVDHGSV